MVRRGHIAYESAANSVPKRTEHKRKLGAEARAEIVTEHSAIVRLPTLDGSPCLVPVRTSNAIALEHRGEQPAPNKLLGDFKASPNPPRNSDARPTCATVR
jgi:hypothetical protein